MNIPMPENPNEFNELMVQVDEELARQGQSIHQRPLNAISVLSQRFGISLPMSPPIPGMHHESFKYWPITQRINEWFHNRYGERLNVDFSIGRVAFLIGEDIWVFRLPRIYGQVKFVIEKRTLKSKHFRTDGKPVIHNILDSIEGLPDGLRASLSNSQLEMIFKYFRLGFNTFSKLITQSGNELVKSALADISTSIDHLLSQVPEYGLSKWSSLQAAEKLLKAVIKKTDGSYPRTHNLDKLVVKAKELGLDFKVDSLIKEIQCTPSIRYGDEECNKNQAITAHHSAIELANRLFEIMA